MRLVKEVFGYSEFKELPIGFYEESVEFGEGDQLLDFTIYHKGHLSSGPSFVIDHRRVPLSLVADQVLTFYKFDEDFVGLLKSQAIDSIVERGKLAIILGDENTLQDFSKDEFDLYGYFLRISLGESFDEISKEFSDQVSTFVDEIFNNN